MDLLYKGGDTRPKFRKRENIFICVNSLTWELPAYI
jgi:hypothetical protein